MAENITVVCKGEHGSGLSLEWKFGIAANGYSERFEVPKTISLGLMILFLLRNPTSTYATRKLAHWW